MRLSEAILLGSVELKAVPYTRADGLGGGCAIGMAEIAAGTGFAESKWPVMKLTLNTAPCGCTKSKQLVFDDPYFVDITCVSMAMAHIFNEHVCEDKTWTLEQLCDWIRTIELTEEPANADVTREREAEAGSTETEGRLPGEAMVSGQTL